MNIPVKNLLFFLDKIQLVPNIFASFGIKNVEKRRKTHFHCSSTMLEALLKRFENLKFPAGKPV